MRLFSRSEDGASARATWTKFRATVLLRLTLVIAAGYLLLAQGERFQIQPAIKWLILAALASNLLFLWLPLRWVESAKFSAGMVLADTIWITALLSYSGHLDADFFVVYFFVLFLAAASENLALMTVATFLVSAAYVYSVFMTKGASVAWSAPTLVRLPFFFAVAALYGFLADRVRQERQISNQLEHLARRDPLTDLPNRRTLEERLERGIARALRSRNQLAILLFDLDEFKYVNDTYGHALGDQYLIAIADRLRSSVRQVDVLGRFQSGEFDTAGRLGGDEFAVVLTDARDPDTVAMVAQRLCSLISEPVQLEDLEIASTASVGVVVFDVESAGEATGTQPIGSIRQQLLIQADRALYSAKEEGRNTVRFHDPEMDRAIRHRVALGQELRGVLDRDDLFLEFQPQVELERDSIVGAEALLRWRHSSRGLVPPEEFIPIAESSGQIQAIGEWVLRTACHEAAAWRKALPPGVPVAVNLSAVQFRDPGLPDAVARALDEEGLPPEMLELELTEGVFLKATAQVRLSLQRLHDEVGVCISLDDFGRGFSSLEYLRRFPIDKLKVDRLFVSAIDEDADARAMVGGIIALAKSLGLVAVAEGVETATQLEFLREKECEQAQGFYFNKPVSSQALVGLLGKEAENRPA